MADEQVQETQDKETNEQKQVNAAAKQEVTQEEIDQAKGVSAIAYLGILFFVPLLTSPDSKFARFHANQGLVLLLFSVIGNIAASMLTIILIGLLLFPVVNIAALVFFVMGLVNALNGEMKPLPLIGGITLIDSDDVQKKQS